jgi:hypothetical protein
MKHSSINRQPGGITNSAVIGAQQKETQQPEKQQQENRPQEKQQKQGYIIQSRSSSLMDESSPFSALRRSGGGSENNENDYNNNQDNTMTTIGSKETTKVRRLRILIAIVIMISAAVISIATYRFLQQSETNTFVMNYQQDTTKIIDGIANQMFEQTLTTFDLYTTNILSVVSSTNQKWPFVTIPYFPVLGSKLRSASDGISITLSTVVHSNQRVEWENYTSIYGPIWVNETIYIQANDAHYYGLNDDNYTIEDQIYSDFGIVPYDDTS